jgi:hypothetical protein
MSPEMKKMACVAKEQDEGRQVRAAAMHAAW